MNYNGTIYRPPLEAGTFLIPVTEGCTHNGCTFCNMYKGVPFRVWSPDEIAAFLSGPGALPAESAEKIRRVYLVGADPFALSAPALLDRAALIRNCLPNVEVISMYARADNIAHKSDEDLLRLKAAGFDDLYVGVECGQNEVMARLRKGYSADDTRTQCLRLNAAGIRHCDLLMLGTAGKGGGTEAAKAAAALENEIRPAKILVNTMTAFAGTELDDDIAAGRFTPAGEKEIVQEEYSFLAALELPECYFWANHPLDSVGIEGWLKRDKEKMLAVLAKAAATVDETEYDRVSRRGKL